MNIRLISFAMFLLFGVSLQTTLARIGETEAQVESRLGKSTTGTGTVDTRVATPKECIVKVYQKNAFTVTVIYYQGVSQCEIYSKAGMALSYEEADAILKNNTFTGAWTHGLEEVSCSTWSWSGDQMEAMNFKLGEHPLFFVQTARFHEAATAKNKIEAAGL